MGRPAVRGSNGFGVPLHEARRAATGSGSAATNCNELKPRGRVRTKGVRRCARTGSASPGKSPAIAVGRAGIEPATLGSKVRLDELQLAARSGNVLQRARTAVATNCSKMQLTETSLYAHPYARLASAQTTCPRRLLGGARLAQILPRQSVDSVEPSMPSSPNA